VRADSVDLVHEVLHAGDTVLAEAVLNDLVVEQRQTLLVDLTESTLVDQFTNRLECWVSVRQVWLHALEHLSGCLGRLHENTHVVLDQTHEAHDLLGLWVHVSETTDADNEEELGLSIHEVVASSLGLAVHANTLGSDGAVLLDVLSGLVVSLGALDLPVLLGLDSSSCCCSC